MKCCCPTLNTVWSPLKHQRKCRENNRKRNQSWYWIDVSRNDECLKWKSPKKMTMTFVKFQEDISLTGELFLHYNYPGNWWAHLKTSGALIMISNDTNLFRRREQKHILRKSKGSWLFRFVCVLEDFYMLMFYGIQDDHLPTGLFKHNFRLALFSM